MLSILDSQDVLRILYQSMLEAPSGSEKRPAVLAGDTDAFERAGNAPVGTPRRTPEPVKALE